MFLLVAQSGKRSDVEYFARNCAPDRCQLNRRARLPHAGFWDLCLELMEFQEAGLDMLVNQTLGAVPHRYVAAFVTFRGALRSGLGKLAAEQAAARAAREAAE